MHNLNNRLIKTPARYNTFTKSAIVIALIITAESCVANIVSSPKPTIIPARGTIEVAFSPNNGVTKTVLNAINEAKNTILVGAYSFTSKDISQALLEAKKRGINIQLILDKSNVRSQYAAATFFNNMGFDLKIDVKHAIFHDKVMIIDAKTVITGSFNFTNAAEKKNAENLLVLRNNPELAKLYTQDWLYNWNQAVSYTEYKRRKNL